MDVLLAFLELPGDSLSKKVQLIHDHHEDLFQDNFDTAQKMKFLIKDFFSKYDQIFSFPLVNFTEEILNGKLHLLCSVTWMMKKQYQNNIT